MDLLINIDVSDLARAIAFYAEAFDLTVTRRLGAGVAELTGLPVRLYLLEKPEGTIGAGKDLRRYDRHWTPVHVDVIVDDVEAAVTRAVAAGARVESGVRVEAYGKIAILSDPFGHGFCFIQFLGRGYDEIADIDAARQPSLVSQRPLSDAGRRQRTSVTENQTAGVSHSEK